MKTSFSKLFFTIVSLSVFGSLAPVRIAAQTFTNLHSFTVPSNSGSNYDGTLPESELIISDGTLYGAAQGGGSNGVGTVFALNIQTTNLTDLHSFALPGTGYTNSDGIAPGTLTLSGSTLYGATSQGGQYGSGTLFAVQTDGTGFTNFHTFTGTALSNNGFNTNRDGVGPNGLVAAGNTLYGTADSGGTNGAGTLFKINTDGSGFTVLHQFSTKVLYEYYRYTNPDGANPVGSMVLSGAMLYGSAASGGTNSNGTIFQINTNGTGFKVVHTMSAGVEEYIDDIDVGETNADGVEPGALILSGNNLYGTAIDGGPNVSGTLFMVNTNGTGFKAFYTSPDLPEGPIAVSGNTVFGVSGNGGEYRAGAVFSVSTSGENYTNLYSFTDGSDGAYPRAGVVFSGQTVYGTTSGGGLFSGAPFGDGFGTVFGVTLSSVPLSVATTSLPGGTTTIAYSQMLDANGGQPPYTWTNIAGALPKGLALAPSGLLSGTPATNGTFNFTVQVTDSLSATATQPLSVQVTLIDTAPPTLSITNIKAGMIVSNSAFTVEGTAKDNVAVSNVLVSLNNGAWNAAMSGNGWSNWTAQVTLIPGTNTIAAYAVDTSGNVSLTTTDKLAYIVTTTLIVRTNGDGGISPAYNGVVLPIGTNLSMTATAKTGSTFTDWTDGLGNVVTNGATLRFVMASNLTFVANLVETAIPTVTITSPANLQKMTNALATVIGKASDDWKVTQVLYQLNNGSWSQPVTTNGWTNWTVTLPLVLGTNKVNAYAMDPGGNLSTTSSVSVISSNTFMLYLAFTNALPLKTNGLFFSLQLSSHLNGHIQVSSNLTSWTTLTNFVGTNAQLNFSDPAATNSSRRYYRAVIP